MSRGKTKTERELEKVRCPGCNMSFISGTKLNRHKRTCNEL